MTTQNQMTTQTEDQRSPHCSSLRYKQELGNIALRRLLMYPDTQAEAIAKHYASHATTALNILKLVELRKFPDSSPELDKTIQMLVGEIKNNHWHDFGIELEWRQHLQS